MINQTHSDETRARMSAAQRKHWACVTEEQRCERSAKISAAQKGRPQDPAHALKVSTALRGRKKGPPSLETRAKIAEKAKARWANPAFKAKMQPLQKEAAAKVPKRTAEQLAKILQKARATRAAHPYVRTEASRAKRSAALRGRSFSLEGRANMSKAAAHRWIQAGAIDGDSVLHFRGKKPKTGKFQSDRQGKQIFYGSSYELKALQLLETDLQYVGFARCNFAIPYVGFDGASRNYIPDFFATTVAGTAVVIEVKPEYMFAYCNNPQKFAAATEFCKQHGFEFQVWSELRLGLSRVTGKPI